MNISITDGYVKIDGTLKVSATYKLFTKEGIDICMPKDRQPTPTDPWVDLNGKIATIGDVNRIIDSVIENLSDLVKAAAIKIPVEKPACRHTICQKCHQFHDPDLICHQPNHDATISQPFGRVATVGDVNQSVKRLLESLAKRFETLIGRDSNVATTFRDEKENWK